MIAITTSSSTRVKPSLDFVREDIDFLNFEYRLAEQVQAVESSRECEGRESARGV